MAQEENDLKVFVWTDVLCEFTCGIVLAIAHSLEEAYEVITRDVDVWHGTDVGEYMRRETEEHGNPPQELSLEPHAWGMKGGD